ncbi:MAG: AAA family ATPase [Robiginitomaculum sp.]
MRIIAIVNQKGGVGKTTTAINLAAALAEQGKRVLLVDIDPQGNASTGLGVMRADRSLTSYDVIVDGADINDAIYETAVEGLTLLPSDMDLSGAELELGAAQGRTTKLKEALAALHKKPDFVLLDCPPSLSLLTVNALTAAHSVIVPLQCEFYALEGLSQLLQTVEMAKGSLNPDLVIEGVMLTMYDPRNRLSGQVVADVRKHLGRAVFKTVIPRNVRIAEAPSFGLPVTSYDRRSKGAQAYMALAREILGRRRRQK